MKTETELSSTIAASFFPGHPRVCPFKLGSGERCRDTGGNLAFPQGEMFFTWKLLSFTFQQKDRRYRDES